MSGSGRQRLFSSFDRPRRRFVQDGEVPVTVVHARPRQGLDALGSPRPGASPQERAESAEAALATERAAREQAERHLREAQATILDLRTKQGHADLARAEADAAAAELRAGFADMRAELTAAQAALATAQDALARQAAAPVPRRGRPPRVVPAPETETGATETGAPPDQPAAAAPQVEVPQVAVPQVVASLDEAPEAPLASVRRGRGRPRGSKSAPKLLVRTKPVAGPAPKVAKPKPLAKPKPKAAARPAPKAAKPKPVQWWVKRPARGKPAVARKRSPRAF